MKISDMFPSKYLKSTDLEGDLTLTIAKLSKEVMKNRDQQDEEKYVIYFKEVEKGLVLNKTNANTLVELYGDDTDDWINKRVVLTSIEISAFGEMQSALRISSKKPLADRKSLLEAYQKLFETATKLKVDGLKDFTLDADASAETIAEAGKQLKKKVEAAEAFQ